jgi:DNA replication and repair protein RecF
MLLELIEVHQFRNLSGAIGWGPGLNILFGENGEGKTNWLEAIYLLATTKSFKTQRPQEAIKFGEEIAVVRGRVARSHDIHRDLQVSLQPNSKILTVNGKRESISSYLSQLNVVAFTADELAVVRGAPDARRRFVDRGATSLHHTYVQTLSDYQRVLKQKNRLLQGAAESGSTIEDARRLIDPWNEQLVRLGGEIHRARSDYITRLQGALDQRLFGREEVSIRYISSLEGKGDLAHYESLFEERLKLRLPAEIAAGYALIGPHRDDLETLFDGHDLRLFGSSGQQRSALILLDLAAISVYYSWHSEYPIFIVDDVDAELDRKRIGHLLEYLEGRAQTFVTTSKEGLVDQFQSRASVYEIKRGSAMSFPGLDIETISAIPERLESI